MDEMLDIMLDVVIDAVKDTLYLLPFLFVTYLVMEWLEHRTGAQAQQAVKRAGVAGPAIGAVLGVVPQCGFSAAASTLYAGRVITMGTLVAVYLSTSDEMLPIFIAEQVPVSTLFAVLGSKVAIGMAAGFIIDIVVRAFHRESPDLRIHELCERDHCDCDSGCATCESNPALAYEHHDDCADGCDHAHHHHDHEHDGSWAGIAKSALRHTVQIALFVLIIVLALNIVLELVGEEALAEFLGANQMLAVVAAAVVGLIPNCAASVAIAQLYIEGVLGCGAMMSGLLCAAGVGVLVLLRTNRHAAENALVIVVLFAVSVLCGFGIDALGIAF